MKQLLLILSTIFFLQMSAQRDTVFVDQHDSVYNSLPMSYRVVDTVEAIVDGRLAIMGQAGCGGSGTINTRVRNFSDTTYFFWEFELINDTLNGAYYFYSDSILVDSLIFNANTPVILTTDTFTIVDSTISLKHVCMASGNGNHQIRTNLFQKRIEINILPESTAGDTVFVDQNDSVYYHLPNGFSIIDTVTGIAEKGAFLQGNTQCPASGKFKSRNLPDTAYYLFWKIELKNSGLIGEYYFGNNSTALDTLQVDTNTSLTQYTDTFRIIADTLNMTWNCNAVGMDSVDISSVVYFTRTEINITPIQSVGLSGKAKEIPKLILYPNPTTSELNFSGIGSSGEETILIYSSSGGLVKKVILRNQSIDVRELTPGFYIIKSEESNARATFIKE